MDQKSKNEKTTLKQGIALFIQNNAKILLGILVFSILVIAGFGIGLQIQKSNLNKEILAVEDLQDLYDEWVVIEDETEKAEKESVVLEEIDAVIARYDDSYAGAQALFLKGKIHFTLEEWVKAGDAFSMIFTRTPESYLASVGLMNAGVAYENGEAVESAITVYTNLVEELEMETGFKSHAMLSLGRLAEYQENEDDALVYYNRLLDEYPNSSWTNTAINRIIYLQSNRNN